MKQIVIIGGGPAGMMAACQSAKLGNSVTVIEKMNRPGRKLLITGKGRCNVTNATFDVSELMENIPVNPRFLYSAFSEFMTYDTIAFFEDLGVKTKIERGNRVFPESDKAVDIVDALVSYTKECGAKFISGTVCAFEFADDNKHINSVICENGEKIPCDSVAICTGGKSYPLTGSTGDGYKLAKMAGHSITPIKPSLVPLEIRQSYIPKLQGLSLKNISISVFDKKSNKVVYQDFGEMLFTHFGVSGPVILSASSRIRNMENDRYQIILDMKPALDEEKLNKRIQRDFEESANKDFINSLAHLLPNKMIPVIVELSKIAPSKKVNQITKEERLNLVSLIKNIKLDITSFRPIEEAIVTSGGVDVKEINPKTMASKIVDNLYFAGEVIDVDAYTGGFNLQIAFSTGYVCGKNM